jgi:hypothetical protein
LQVAGGVAGGSYLHGGGRAADPAVLLVGEAAELEGAPRLAHVAVQVAYGHQARHGRQHCRLGWRLPRRDSRFVS